MKVIAQSAVASYPGLPSQLFFADVGKNVQKNCEGRPGYEATADRHTARRARFACAITFM